MKSKDTLTLSLFGDDNGKQPPITDNNGELEYLVISKKDNKRLTVRVEESEVIRRDDICDEWRDCGYGLDCMDETVNINTDCLLRVAEDKAKAEKKAQKRIELEFAGDGIAPDRFETFNLEMPKTLKGYSVKIQIARGDSGGWYNAASILTPIGGSGYAPFPKFSEKYPARDDALRFAFEIAYNQLMDYEKNAKKLDQLSKVLADWLQSVLSEKG